MPKVSIIIAVYNAERYLRQCLDCVVNQTLRDIEIICVNDGSYDNSLAILSEYAKNDSRIQIITKANEGLGAASARNIGLEMAAGEYISVLDSDDFFELDMLEAMYTRAEQTNADIVLCNGWEYDNSTGEYLDVWGILNVKCLPDKDVFSRKDCRLYQLSQGQAWNRLFRRGYLEKHSLRFQHIKYTDDAYFTFANMALAKRISVVNRKLCYYRINTSSSQSSSITYTPDSAYVPYLTLKQSLTEWGIYEDVEQSLINCGLTFMRRCYDKVIEFSAFEYLHNKYKSEVFPVFDIDKRPPDYFFDSRLYDWIQLIIKNTASEAAFKAAYKSAQELKLPGTTAILRL